MITFKNLEFKKEKNKYLLQVVLIIIVYEIAGGIYSAIFGLLPQLLGFSNIEILVIIIKFWHLSIIPVIIFFSRKWNINLAEELKPFRYSVLVVLLILSVSIYVLNPIISSPLKYLKALANEELLVFIPRTIKYDFFFFFNLVAIVITGPIVEEFLHRGLIFNYLKKNFSIQFSIIVSSFLFALIHFDFTGQGIIKLIYGFMFCISYQKTKSLFVPIIFHMLINTCSVFLTEMKIEMDAIAFSRYIPVLLFSVLAVFFVIRKLHKTETGNNEIIHSEKT